METLYHDWQSKICVVKIEEKVVQEKVQKIHRKSKQAIRRIRQRRRPSSWWWQIRQTDVILKISISWFLSFRSGYIDQVRSLRNDSPDFDFTNLEDESLKEDIESGFDYENEQISNLKNEIHLLKKQVKCLKKMAVFNMFESREELRDFFSDIW